MTNKLFSEFNAVSSKQWKQKIQFNLKGNDYNNTLVWQTNEGISVKPFYHAEDFDDLPEVSNTKATQWQIGQSIFVAQVDKSNTKAIEAIRNGAESLLFIIPNQDISVKELLKNINLEETSIHFEPQFLSDDFIKQLPRPSKAKITTHTDIIGHLAKTGHWYSTLKTDFKTFEAITKQTNSFTVDTSLYQNAGASIIQQLAYGLAQANEYVNYLENAETANQYWKKQTFEVHFKMSIGSNYFFEIAKLRACRKLWHTLASEYQINADFRITATPTKRNKTLYGFNSNMLRTTTECMSAILGGANTICNMPYDAIYHKNNDCSERLSRNQLLILKHESSFDSVNNPVDGSYYTESITHQLAEKALEVFKDIEAHGGFLKQLKNGTIQRKMKESAAKEQHQFDTGQEVLVGSNKYAKHNERMKNELEIYPFLKVHQRKTLIEPLIEKRLSENLELNKLKHEN